MKKIYILPALLLAMGSCIKIKDKPVTPDDFNVSVPKNTYKVGETVTFTMTGNPNFITFYSGERGLNYANINRTTAAGTPKLQFTSARANGTQAGSLQVLASSNFAGTGADSATTVRNIAAASWTDLTSRATLSTGAAVASGAIDLTDVASANKPVYIAFKYTGMAGTIQNKWTITALTVTNTLPDGSIYTIANLSSAAITNYGVPSTFSPGWVGYKVSNNTNWVITAGTSLVITGPATAAASTAASEAWAFTGGITLNHVSPDTGTPIKGTDTRLTSPNYTYAYKTAGTYDVVFLGTNASVYGQQEIARHIQLTITN